MEMLYILIDDIGLRRNGEFFEIIRINRERKTLKVIKSFKKIDDALDFISVIVNKRQYRRECYSFVDLFVFSNALKDVKKRLGGSEDDSLD